MWAFSSTFFLKFPSDADRSLRRFTLVPRSFGEDNQVEKMGGGNNIKLESTIYTPARKRSCIFTDTVLPLGLSIMSPTVGFAQNMLIFNRYCSAVKLTFLSTADFK